VFTVFKTIALVLAAAALCVAVFVGPARVHEMIFPTPSVPADWQALLDAVRAFEQRMGFRATQNFKLRRDAAASYTTCVYVPRFTLPYSYQDPMIRWSDATDEQACRAAANGDDVYFTHVEAVGESATAMTQRILAGKLDRFLYLVIHEDCHDQFDLPFGFEEPLCNVLAYAGIAAFARKHYGWLTPERQAARRYVQRQARLTHAVVRYYGQIERLYARHARGRLTDEAALRARAYVFGAAERTLGWYRDTMSNVGLANEMTYSRHYPLIERVHRALGHDVAKTVAFFKAVDRAKPAAQTVLKAVGASDTSDIRFVRAYEAAIVETVLRELPHHTRGGAPSRIK